MNRASSGTLATDGLRQDRLWIGYVFGVALLFRVIILCVTFAGNDASEYYDDVKIALNVVGGKGYAISYEYRNWLFYEGILKTARLEDPILEGTRTTAVKQPAYPLLLAGLFYAFGPKNLLMVFLINAMISSITVSVLFLCLRGTDPVRALAVALGAALYPAFAFHAAAVPESTSLLLLLVAALWLWLSKIKERASGRLWVVGGAIGGLAALTDPVTLPFIVLCFWYGLYLDQRSRGKRFAAFAMAIAVGFLVVSPWLGRNFLVFNRFPVFKSGLGLVFNQGLEFSGKGSWIGDERLVALEKAGRKLSELEEDEAIRRELVSRFPSYWREYVTYDIPHNLLHLGWDVPRYWDNYSIRYLAGRRIPYLLLLGLALPHLLRTTARLLRQPRRILHRAVPEVSALVLIATFTVVYGLFGAFHSRYRLPVELGLFIFAGTMMQPIADLVWRWWASSPLVGRDSERQAPLAREA